MMMARSRHYARLPRLLALVVLTGASSSPAFALVNGGFETGTLDGWYASPGSVAFVAAASSPLGRGIGDPGEEWNPTEGGFFGVLHTAPVSPESGRFTLLSATFAASLGDLLAFDVFFDAGEEAWSGRRGTVRLVNESAGSADLLYSRTVADVGDYGAADWSRIARPIASAGAYHLELSLFFDGEAPAYYDPKLGSAIGVDQLQLTQVPPVPEPGTLLLLGPAVAGLGGLGAWRRRGSRGTAQIP